MRSNVDAFPVFSADVALTGSELATSVCATMVGFIREEGFDDLAAPRDSWLCSSHHC